MVFSGVNFNFYPPKQALYLYVVYLFLYVCHIEVKVHGFFVISLLLHHAFLSSYCDLYVLCFQFRSMFFGMSQASSAVSQETQDENMSLPHRQVLVEDTDEEEED